MTSSMNTNDLEMRGERLARAARSRDDDAPADLAARAARAALVDDAPVADAFFAAFFAVGVRFFAASALCAGIAAAVALGSPAEASASTSDGWSDWRSEMLGLAALGVTETESL